jgi:hypothetical protein
MCPRGLIEKRQMVVDRWEMGERMHNLVLSGGSEQMAHESQGMEMLSPTPIYDLPATSFRTIKE